MLDQDKTSEEKEKMRNEKIGELGQVTLENRRLSGDRRGLDSFEYRWWRCGGWIGHCRNDRIFK